MKLQWYIFGLTTRSFLGTLFFVTVSVFLVVSLQSFSRYDELSLSLLISRLPYLVPIALTLAVPLSLLIGTLLSFGRLSAENEILAMRMGGVHPFRLLTPVLVLGMALTILMLYVNGTLAPLSKQRAGAITRDDLRNFLDSMQERRVNQFSSDRVSMRWRAADESGALLDVGFDLHPQDGGDVSGEAARARIARDDALDYLWFDFTDLRMTTGKDSAPQSFRELTLSYSVASLFGSNGNRERRSSMTNRELEFRAGRAVRSGAPEDDEDVLSYRTECAARTSLAFACIVFVLVGAPLGMRFRQGSFLGAGFMAVLLAFVVYYPLHEVGWHLSWEGTLPSGVAMAIPGTVVGSFGLLLLFRVMKR